MTVKELIKVLKQYEGDMPVCYRCCSEYSLLSPDQLRVVELQEPRRDCWVGEKRPDKPSIPYLVFPGN